MTEKDNQVDKPRWPPKRSHHDLPRTAPQSHRTEVAPSAPQVEPFTQHASGKEGEEQDDTKRGEAYASSYNGGVSRGTPSLPMGTEANLPSAAETRVAAENAIHTDEGKKRAAGPANEDSRPRKRVKVETEAKDDGTSSTLGRRQADASTPIVISKSSPAPDSLPSSEGRRGPHHTPCRPMTRMTTGATAATSDSAKVVPHFHLSSDDRHPGKGSKRARNAADDPAAAAAHPRKRQKLETGNASTIPTAPPPALAQPPSSEPTLPIPTYLDALVKLPGKGSRFLRLAETTSCIALSTLEQATHLHLRPFHQPEDGSPVKLEPKQYATILKCASNLSWLMLEDVVTTGTEDDLGRAMKKVAPKPLRVLSLAVHGDTKRIDTRVLDTLLAPFSEVDHMHLNVPDARLEIPPRARIRGWHIDGRCGFGFIGRVEEYIASGHLITTLNFLCEANDLDGQTLRAMKELVNRAAPTLTCLGISPDVVKGKDTELDDDFVAGLALKKLTRLVLHLPFRESQLPNPPSSENPKVYPKTLERVKGTWGTATTLLQRLSDTTQTASRLKEVTIALHGEIPESDTRESVKATWWGAQRNEFLRAFTTSITTLLGAGDLLRSRTLCIDMSSLHFDAEFPLDYCGSSWLPPYLFPDIAARRVWLGPRPIPSLDLPQPVDGLRSSLVLPVSAEKVSVERLDACIAVHHASGGEGMSWKTPDAVCPLWCAPLWWIVEGSRVLA